MPLLTVGLLLASAALQGEAASSALPSERLRTAAPVGQFQLPFFDDNGRRTLLITGEQAEVAQNGTVQVQRMILRLYSPEDAVHPQTIITCNDALIDPQKGTAQGKRHLLVSQSRNGFSASGMDWLWNRATNSIIIRKKARVTFRSDMGSVLKVDGL